MVPILHEGLRRAAPMTRFRRGDRYVYRLTVGEHLLVSLHGNRRETLYALTPTGALLWEELAGWSTVNDLATRLADQFEVPLDTAAEDVKEFLAQLESLGALDQQGEH